MQVFLFDQSDKSLPGPTALLRPCLTSDVAAKEGLCQIDSSLMGSVQLKTDERRSETDTHVGTYSTFKWLTDI